jgi:hypothetical protein
VVLLAPPSALTISLFFTGGLSRKGGGGGFSHHELPNQESVDRHPLFYISKKTQFSSQMQIFFLSSSANLLTLHTPLFIYIQRMRHAVSVHPAMVVNSLQHFWDKHLL